MLTSARTEAIDRNGSSEEEFDVNNDHFIDPQAEDQELKGQLLRRYSGYLGSLKQEFMKKRKKGKLPKEARQQLLDWWSRHYKWPYPSVSISTLLLVHHKGLFLFPLNVLKSRTLMLASSPFRSLLAAMNLIRPVMCYVPDRVPLVKYNGQVGDIFSIFCVNKAALSIYSFTQLESQKLALAESTGLDQKQINNWFINQRKRHWKPSEDMQFVVMDAPHSHYYMENVMGNQFPMDLSPALL
ncbi:hypothetical protein Pint_09793 [Pistacia integerrima]|uniref:Uncharacterized protein n=1 Tax=Pistacia integerrima TaxID=434235 RepID=A0ACC0XHN5_9ROSI|nr:hypothetical protein Pint_09793 [Pistacia integerrima]